MKLSKKYSSVIMKYQDESYLDSVHKYVLAHDLSVIGIDVKDCYDTSILRDIMRILVRRILSGECE